MREDLMMSVPFGQVNQTIPMSAILEALNRKTNGILCHLELSKMMRCAAFAVTLCGKTRIYLTVVMGVGARSTLTVSCDASNTTRAIASL